MPDEIDRKKMQLLFMTLSSTAQDAMMQLFVQGPTWDGDVLSKSGRNELVSRDFAKHRHGWAYLTDSGLDMAITVDVSRWVDKRWHKKQQNL
jgi:hypothetical protein